MSNNTVTDNVKRAMAKTVIDEILQIIESDESKTITKEELIAHIDKITAELPEGKLEKRLIDDTAGKSIRERFWQYGNVSCDDSTLLLRNTVDSDRDSFLRLQREYSALRSLLEEDGYCSLIWRDHNDNTALMLSITENGEYVGYCGIKDLSKKPWEIAIELLPEWTHRGIGTTVITAMLDAVKERLGVVDFRVRIDPANIASQNLFEKLGAQPNGISKFILHKEEEIRQCEEANLHLINDALITIAKKFDVEPRKLLSHVLEYTLSWR